MADAWDVVDAFGTGRRTYHVVKSVREALKEAPRPLLESSSLSFASCVSEVSAASSSSFASIDLPSPPRADLSFSGEGNTDDSALLHLPDDVLLLILTCLPSYDLLLRIAPACGLLAATVREAGLWLNQLQNFVAIDNGGGYKEGKVENTFDLTVHQMQRCCLLSHTRRYQQILDVRKAVLGLDNDTEKEKDTPKSPRLISVLPSRNSMRTDPVCLATTKDRDTEGLDNVLCSSIREPDNFWQDIISQPKSAILSPPVAQRLFNLPVWQEGTYWSSTASPAPDTNETLLFATRCPLALITDVAVKPFREMGFFGLDAGNTDTVYSWPAAQVRVYRLPVGLGGLLDPSPSGHFSGFPCMVSSHAQLESEVADGGEDDNAGNGTAASSVAKTLSPPHASSLQSRLIGYLLAGHAPTYVSPVRTAPNAHSDSWQHFPLPNQVVGNVVTVTLMGKNNRQFSTSGYYVCVDQVVARGLPLYTDQKQAALMHERFQKL